MFPYKRLSMNRMFSAGPQKSVICRALKLYKAYDYKICLVSGGLPPRDHGVGRERIHEFTTGCGRTPEQLRECKMHMGLVPSYRVPAENFEKLDFLTSCLMV